MHSTYTDYLLKSSIPQLQIIAGLKISKFKGKKKLKQFFSGRLFNGVDGFCDVQFEDRPTDDPDNPIIRQEHAALAITRLVCQFPGTTK